MNDDDDEYRAKVEALYEDLRAACEGHQHQEVMHAVAMLLTYALNFFEEDMSRECRIDNIAGLMKDLMTQMTREDS